MDPDLTLSPADIRSTSLAVVDLLQSAKYDILRARDGGTKTDAPYVLHRRASDKIQVAQGLIERIAAV